jgi:hypothetical protein
MCAQAPCWPPPQPTTTDDVAAPTTDATADAAGQSAVRVRPGKHPGTAAYCGRPARGSKRGGQTSNWCRLGKNLRLSARLDSRYLLEFRSLSLVTRGARRYSVGWSSSGLKPDFAQNDDLKVFSGRRQSVERVRRAFSMARLADLTAVI